MVEGSGWFIDDIELPIAPQVDSRKITREFKSQSIFSFFPTGGKSTANSYDYTLEGDVYVDEIVFALDQIARSADTNTVILTPPEDEMFMKILNLQLKI